MVHVSDFCKNSVCFSNQERDLNKWIHHRPRLCMTRVTPSLAASSLSNSMVLEPLCAEVPITAGRPPYTLGNEGAVAEIGLELPPVSLPELLGDSGGGRPDVSVMRESEYVRSNDWARFVRERGLEICSFILASRRESEPRLSASSVCLALLGIPVPCVKLKLTENSEIKRYHNARSEASVSNNPGTNWPYKELDYHPALRNCIYRLEH